MGSGGGDAGGEVLEQTEADLPGSSRRARAWWRTPVAIGLVLALLALGGGLVARYRHDHRDEWRTPDWPWHHVDVSDDGRTLTFVAFPGSDCWQSDGVTFGSDPTQGGTVSATLRMTHQSIRDGHVVFCHANLGPLPDTTVTFDRPVPRGTTFVDTTMPDTWDCGTPTRQVLGQPTSAIDPYGCGP